MHSFEEPWLSTPRHKLRTKRLSPQQQRACECVWWIKVIAWGLTLEILEGALLQGTDGLRSANSHGEPLPGTPRQSL